MRIFLVINIFLVEPTGKEYMVHFPALILQSNSDISPVGFLFTFCIYAIITEDCRYIIVLFLLNTPETSTSSTNILNLDLNKKKRRIEGIVYGVQLEDIVYYPLYIYIK